MDQQVVCFTQENQKNPPKTKNKQSIDENIKVNQGKNKGECLTLLTKKGKALLMTTDMADVKEAILEFFILSRREIAQST